MFVANSHGANSRDQACGCALVTHLFSSVLPRSEPTVLLTYCIQSQLHFPPRVATTNDPAPCHLSARG